MKTFPAHERYTLCVQSVVLYGSETWPIRDDDVMRLEHTEKKYGEVDIQCYCER